VKFCVLLMPSGPIKITGIDLAEGIKSEKAVEDEELVALLKQVRAGRLSPPPATAKRDGGEGLWRGVRGGGGGRGAGLDGQAGRRREEGGGDRGGDLMSHLLAGCLAGLKEPLIPRFCPLCCDETT
jgi:hypothetical protein